MLAVVVIAVAFLAEAQRGAYFEYLGNGARRVLVWTSLLSAITGASCLAAAVWLPAPSAARSLLGGCFAALLVIPAVVARQAPERVPLKEQHLQPGRPGRSLQVLVLEGVSWELLLAGASDGRLPVFARCLAGGVGGPLRTLEPYDRAALFTTAATGKRPSKHGILSTAFARTPAGPLGLLPVLPGTAPFAAAGTPRPDGERQSLTFWEILARRGHEVTVLGWPHAAAREGTKLWASEEFFTRPEPRDGDALPREIAARAALFRAGAQTLDRPLVRALTPEGLTNEDLARARPLEGAARDLSVLGASLGAVPQGPGSVSTIVLSGLIGPARIFGAAAEPSRYWGLSPESGEARARALIAYYRFLDDLLFDLIEREGEDRTICILAPAGWGPPPPLNAVSQFARGREPEASPEGGRYGFVLFFGSGIRKGYKLTSASVLDVAPTLLVLAGEPMARDLDGRVLAEAFDERFVDTANVPLVPTYEPRGPQ